MRRRVCWMSLWLVSAAAAPAQEPPRRTVVAAPQYDASGFHRFLFGANYRDLWTMPVSLPVLDLRGTAGGLTPVRRLGHGQTRALAFDGADGSAYTFRSVVKDPVGLLPLELRQTVAAGFVRDQMSSQHPAGHVIVPDLMEALGLLHNTPRLVVLPDDPALGEFRAEFAGVVGDFEEFTGQARFGGAEEILSGAELWRRLDASAATRIDARAFLVARLLDHLIGDWDRHRNQWRWARFAERPLLQPIAEDRDQAFVRFQGVAASLARPGLPLLMSFGPRYPHLEGLLFSSWDVDRRLLAGLEWPAWEEAVAFVRARLGDDVFERAVRRMPQEYHARVGAGLLEGLKARRERLPEHARRYYLFLARQADVRGTEAAERAELERFAGGDLELRLFARDGRGADEPYFRRRFRRGETEEVRLHLLGGDDEVVTQGAPGGIRVRVVGGAGADRVDDSAVGGLRVSDHEGADEVRPGPGTRFDRRVYHAPPPNPRGEWIPARDWGRRTLAPLVRFTGNPELGVVANLAVKTTGYGFRKDPWADQQTWRVSYSTRVGEVAGEYRGRFRFENSNCWLDLHARASGFDIVRFYGFGNESAASREDDFYRAEQDQLSFAPELGFRLGARTELQVGPLVKHAATELAGDSALARLSPYGIEDFTQVGLSAALSFDSTDRSGLPTRGMTLTAGGSFFPRLASVEHPFGALRGEATLYATRGVTLGLTAGGKRVFGTYPFHEAAYLGGQGSLRGLRSQRYAGDAVLYGQAELYLPLTRIWGLVPGELGVFGLSDVGRVFLEGERSRRWHRGLGGGVYYVSPKRNNTFGVALARSEGRTGVYLRVGTAF